MSKQPAVVARIEEISYPTYLPAPPDKNPMFLEKRVYQGSSGKVYPLPFTDRIAEKPVDRKWKAVWIENEFLRVLILPELGGRIHRLQDKTNGYDLIYHQEVIKPALVGLAGPWISGGIEFNWPQHHRPATFLPVDFQIEECADGSKIVWCSDHDPMTRMKGMHGVCLHPGRAYVELKVRAYNRTPFVQTFLWWANVATRVHEGYQSFFPPDVHYVADHARRSMSEYPLAKGSYYGVNYAERARNGVPENECPKQFVPPRCHSALNVECSMLNVPHYPPNDLSWYANIPVPTSYMCMGSQEDFFGGYDHKAQAGIVHIADHHIAPGKKQWTWGNHEFGYAWDRNLTDPNERGESSPYIELMAGVFTDNQPDFSFLQPGETKTWSQYWYPIQRIGPAQHANLDAAVSLRVLDCGGKRSATPLSRAPSSLRSAGAVHNVVRLGISVTREIASARITLSSNGKRLRSFTHDLAPGKPVVETVKLPKGVAETDLTLRVTDQPGNVIISYQPKPRAKVEVPPPASEPPAPADIGSADGLFITGLHLEQYRHATRCPTLYWREALRRDPGDARCNNGMGLWHLRRGEFEPAETHFRKAIERLTQRNANPYDGEPFYNLGLCLRYQLDAQSDLKSEISDFKFAAAYAAFSKATWNQAWAAAASHALAEMDCRRSDWATALEHLNQSLRFNTDNIRTRNLKVIVLRKLANVGQASSLSLSGRMPDPRSEANVLLKETLALDPLDWWARHLNGEPLTCDLPTRLDLAHDYARAGFSAEAIELLNAVGTRASARFNDRRRTARGSGVNATLPNQSLGALPMVHYTLGWLHEQLATESIFNPVNELLSHMRQKFVANSVRHYEQAAALRLDYCFPSRLEDIAILEGVIRANPRDARAPYYLGNLFYDRRRHAEAIHLWQQSAKLDPNYSVVWRNLGIGYFNIARRPAQARAAYDRAFKTNPADARLLFERDQLWKRLGEKPAKRLRELEKRPDLIAQRDDLSIELCALYNQTGQPAKALVLVSSRRFQPWEGGEGGPLGQWVRAHLALGRTALQFVGRARHSVRAGFERSVGAHGVARPTQDAAEHFVAALAAPLNLGEARHLLANQSDVYYWLGCALAAQGETKKARKQWLRAATFKGDFQAMSVRAYSEMTYYSALSWQRLGQSARAKKLFRNLLAYAQDLQESEAKIDYFATSLPTMLLFDDDLQFRQETTALFLQAQAHLGLGSTSKGRALLKTVLRRDPNHALAADLLGEQDSIHP